MRPEHCRRVLTTAREWGELWHLVGAEREWRNAVVRARDVHDYGFVAWLYGPTALTPHQLPSMFARAAEPEPEDPSPFRPLETAAR